MSRFLPKSLFGQTILILLFGLVVSHAVGAWIYAGAREQAVRAVGGFAAAQRVANLTRLVEEAPADWRARLVAALSDPSFRVALAAQPPEQLPADADGAAKAIEDYVRQQLPDQPDRQVRVTVLEPALRPPGTPFGPFFDGRPPPGPMGGMGRMGGRMRDMMGPNFGGWRGLQVAVRLSDGQWLSFATNLPQGAPSVSWQFIVSMALMGLIVLAVSVWAVRRVTAPLGLLSAAADRLGRDVTAEPLAEAGTAEMQRAARAFNRMQERLRRLVESRTQMLAALSHDLRTPLTLLRLRSEEVADTAEREKMLATIGEMDEMIGSTLAFARDEVRAEPRRRVDIAALLASIVDDMADAGLPVSMTQAAPTILDCQPGALKRAIANLLDNAVKYGKCARVAIDTTAQAVEIVIDDDGPGIPEAELPRVFQPFYRVEDSRSRDTGGTGLGLAIAQAIVQAHGGELTLANRPGGGLRACIGLPL
ncbi:MAG: HAMP domain-containing protein [Rhizobiales bacterium]|nr:HAMP domain-containing protein [Hyphomicrobiales bacterium]